MQNLWKYIDDLVGKGLDLLTIGKFLWYAGATLLTLSMPIAILISSIMTFGNLGESFELVAIKSSGISLLRFMRPLMWVSVLLCFITFLFANYVIPYADLKFKTLYAEIRYKRPGLDLKEGSFFTAIQGFAIKVGKKDADGKTIHNVIIYEQQGGMPDNCIIAEKGVMKTSDDKRFLEFTLNNGTRYQERRSSDLDTSSEFIQTHFKEYKKLIDLSSLDMAVADDSTYRNEAKMLSVRQLGKIIDSLKISNANLKKQFSAETDNALRTTFHVPDSTWKKISIPPIKATDFLTLIPDSAKTIVNNNISFIASNMKSNLQFTADELKVHREELIDHQVEWQRKFSLSMACLVLFFIGAPLGSIIRKGGFGLPLVFAIIFFLLFHLLNMFGEKFAKGGVTSVFTGMWMSVIVLIPIGIFLTYKAMHDSQLFNREFYSRIFRKIRSSSFVNILLRKK